MPFIFDVHAVIYCDDAPELETKLHNRLWDKRMNMVNDKKEFFKASLAEIETAVAECHGRIEFTKLAEAAAYRKTLAMRASAGKDAQTVQVELKPVEAARARLEELKAGWSS